MFFHSFIYSIHYYFYIIFLLIKFSSVYVVCSIYYRIFLKMNELIILYRIECIEFFEELLTVEITVEL